MIDYNFYSINSSYFPISIFTFIIPQIIFETRSVNALFLFDSDLVSYFYISTLFT